MKRKESGKPPRAGAPRERPASPPRERAAGAPRERAAGNYADPYQRARRPGPAGETAPPYARERRPPRRDAGEGGFGGRERGGREGGGFTVTLDPDVARVFRGDASVNKALRLVMQLMQVVQGPRAPGPRPERRGYQGSAEARGFTRKPRFEEDEQ